MFKIQRNTYISTLYKLCKIDVENLTKALRKGNYGKCVYEMNNDVCDHQVVNIEFENGSSASFSMIAYTESMCARKVYFSDEKTVDVANIYALFVCLA